MNRRQLLAGLASSCGSASFLKPASPLGPTSEVEHPLRIQLDQDQALADIPNDFIGLGYEISSVARSGLLSAANSVYVELVKTLGKEGIIRIGGNTADYASYGGDAKPVSSPKSTVVNRQSLKELGSFLDATGWKLIWCLNLGERSEDEAVEEAQTISEFAKDKLAAFEIGNEVDLFEHEGHRPKGYTFDSYLNEYRRYKTALRARLPRARLAGPDAAGRTAWVSQFAAAEGGDLKLLTEHYYRGNQNPSSSLDMLLNPDPKLISMLGTLQQLSASTGLPYRICETNSFSGGGKPGVSGTFGAALWVLDYLFTLASYNAAGVNIETGVNQLDFVSSYSPIGDDEHGTYTARPEYYGMLAFAQASRGKRLTVTLESGGVNVSCYAVGDGQNITATIINKDRARAVTAVISCKKHLRKATALRLTAPTLESSIGVTLGEASVSAQGHWRPVKSETLQCRGQEAYIGVSPGSAALVTLFF